MSTHLKIIYKCYLNKTLNLIMLFIEIENLIQNCVWICKKYLDGQTNTEVAQ